MERIKMIWEFRGPNAHPTAEHHVIHLREFIAAEGLENTLCDTEKVSDMFSRAYLVVERKHMEDLRQRLKPHRGQLYNE
ncbi:hypothetical protein POV27_20055 [Aureisphaera galaxeae]|uniref:hypothetical protein n=1 Tax=Aureisphaera galaxeae TaxID=1538023 RepID=UPI0023507589|nr:hypothetical protein [Aureisphaera galaxeae]MDC8006359.1 hypothetical protein [Aureisphaera galaxeae]